MKIIAYIKNRHKLVIALVVIAAVAGFAYYRSQQQNLEDLESTTVQSGDLQQTLTLSGSVVASDTATVNFLSGGRLVALPAKEGTTIAKGQFIGALDQRQVKKNLDKALNDFLQDRWDLDENREVYEDVIITDSIKRILDKSQFTLNNAVLDVEIQQLSIEFSNLYAPISGIVTNTFDLHPGMNVSVTQPIVEIVDPDSLYFELTADQTEVTELQKGITGELHLDAYIDEPIEGTIEHISFTPKSGESSTVYAVKFTFMNSSNQDYRYRVGMTGDVDFITNERTNTLYVPFKFVSEKDGKKFVKVMKQGALVEQEVTTGIETDTDIEILSGVSKGTQVYD